MSSVEAAGLAASSASASFTTGKSSPSTSDSVAPTGTATLLGPPLSCAAMASMRLSTGAALSPPRR